MLFRTLTAKDAVVITPTGAASGDCLYLRAGKNRQSNGTSVGIMAERAKWLIEPAAGSRPEIYRPTVYPLPPEIAYKISLLGCQPNLQTDIVLRWVRRSGVPMFSLEYRASPYAIEIILARDLPRVLNSGKVLAQTTPPYPAVEGDF